MASVETAAPRCVNRNFVAAEGFWVTVTFPSVTTPVRRLPPDRQIGTAAKPNVPTLDPASPPLCVTRSST